jgi:hypothetical protein
MWKSTLVSVDWSSEFMELVEVVVGQYDSDKDVFKGFKACFMGEKISDFMAGDRRRFTLYKCGWNRLEGYRVYDSDETNPRSPRYELMPHEGQKVDPNDPHRVYHRLYGPSEVVEHWPVFAGEVDALKITNIDANASDPAWTERRTL